ncbi:protein PIN-LIKES 5-like [Cucurbita moschata]|uniref:Protein PIN-LIKES 5-like n=1 Tax=Cucurbita moschata TaxID=3662 RepID=A0A6J1E5L6_CUCMO|nr:protein PIN-LIKES 5-like [Cucurbita moschata]XP_022923233.1 protein PIN-LIKES 5-like [Cucurbita moschata]
MDLLSLLEVASMPNLQVLLICLLGAFLATDYCTLFPAHARTSLNKIVFTVFTPCLMFSNLVKTVTFEDIVSWWFMPINIGLNFLIGGILGWIVVQILRPDPSLEGLVIAASSAGNLGNLLLIIIPAICSEHGNPFGDHDTCTSLGLSYASFSNALGGFYLWTSTYHLVKTSSLRLKALEQFKAPDHGSNGDLQTHLLSDQNGEQAHLLLASVSSTKTLEQVESQEAVGNLEKQEASSVWAKTVTFLWILIQELMAPPTLGAMVGFIFGAVAWLRHLVVGDNAPFRAIEAAAILLGNGAIPCTTLILGGNLIQGLRSSKVKATTILGVIAVRYFALPAIGVLVVKAADRLGFLAADPLYQFLLMIQYATPPAMSISTMTQLFGVGQEECSVILLWSYLAAALSLALWSALIMWLLS